jgi:hypothetical protein
MKNMGLTILLVLVSAGLVCAAEGPALEHVRKEADKMLKAQPHSVMEKTRMPPSGDKHDYLSLAPYSWPDPSKPDGLPWINRDGKVNPESREGTDHNALGHMCSEVETLALAYRLTKHEPYAAKAVEVAKVWFLDPATKMNPNLEYGQGVPVRSTGRGTGIIDTVGLIKVVQSIGGLEGSPAWTPEIQKGMKAWFRAYLDWLLKSKNGLSEATFVGDLERVRTSVELGRERIATQIELDGRQPLELKRTKSYSYSLYNLEALFILAEYGPAVGVDLFGYRSPNGRTLRAALDYMVPYFKADAKWPGEQISDIKPRDPALAGLLRRAANAYHEPKYEAMIQGADLAESRFQLLWPASTVTSPKK